MAALLCLWAVWLSPQVVAADEPSAEWEARPAAGEDLFPGPTLQRDELVAAVLARNLDVRAARAAFAAAQERAGQVTALPDPEVSVGVAPLSIASSDVDFGASVEARQRLPYPGKLRLRGEVAEARAEARRVETDQVRLELARLADELFYDLYLVDRAQEINAEHVRLLEELKVAATHRYAAGLVPQQVPLQAEVELTHLVHRAVTLRTERSVAVARLNALLHRPPYAALPPPAPTPPGVSPEADAAAALERRLSHGDPAVVAEGASHADHAVGSGEADEPGTPTPDAGTGFGAGLTADLAGHGSRADAELVAELADQAVAARPELVALEAELAARRVERELAGLERKPDFGVMGSYSSMWRQSAHQWMVGVTVSLPVWGDRLDAAEAEADAAVAEIRARREAVADEVRFQVARAAEELAEMAHVVEMYQGRLLPAARDQVRAARTGFETGRVDFTALIEAQRNLRSVELGYEMALTDRYRRRAALERALGPPPPLPDDPDFPELSDPDPDLAAPAAGGAS